MRLSILIIVLALCFVNCALGETATNTEVEEPFDIFAFLKKLFPNRWLEVPLDHFNLFDNRTWKMRYLVNEKNYEDGGPIFIEVGGEWTIDGTVLIMGQLSKLAKKHKGVLIETEHRYYGESLPFGDDFSIENLKYLQIEQALEDIAYFIEKFKELNPKYKDSKVIIHGCSYPGMLVTWMRLRFPHIVDIVYASSAPLGVGLNYPEFFEVVNDVYANVSSKCINTIKRGYTETNNLLKTTAGVDKVKKAFKGWNCGNAAKMHPGELLQRIMSVLNVMHDPVEYEDLACLVMSMDTDDLEDYQRLANFIKFKTKNRDSCGNDEPTDEEVRNSKSWSYQTCTEMGTFTTISRENSHHPFEIDMTVEQSVENCVSEFGGIVTEDILRAGTERVTRRYGGKKPKVTKVLTVQGTNDPWKHLAHLGDYAPEAPVWVIKGSHCIDVSMAPGPPALEEVKDKIRDQLSKWIEEIS